VRTKRCLALAPRKGREIKKRIEGTDQVGEGIKKNLTMKWRRSSEKRKKSELI